MIKDSEARQSIFGCTKSEWIKEDVIEKEMEYISRMTEGLTTGTMSNDTEYIYLKNKIIKDIISDKVALLKKEFYKMEHEKIDLYEHARKVQDEALERAHEDARQVAMDNSKPFRLSAVSRSGGKYNDSDPFSIGLNNLKKLIEMELKKNNKKDKIKKTTKKSVKKTIKKKI